MAKKKKVEIKKEENIWIDVHNDAEMAKYGVYRCAAAEPRDPSVWTKTSQERRILKTLKRSFKYGGHFYSNPHIQGKVRSILVVNLKKGTFNTKKSPFNKSTYSFNCLDTEIKDILRKFYTSKGSIIAKVSFDGRTISI